MKAISVDTPPLRTAGPISTWESRGEAEVKGEAEVRGEAKSRSGAEVTGEAAVRTESTTMAAAARSLLVPDTVRKAWQMWTGRSR